MDGELRVRAESVPQPILFTGSEPEFRLSAAVNDISLRTSDAASAARLGPQKGDLPHG